MAKERLPMRKILEILRLRFVLGLTVRETSAALGVSTGAVSRTTERALGSELTYETAAGLGFDELEARLYPKTKRVGAHVEPDVRWVHRELRRVGVTLELLHQEYRAEHGAGALGYSAFCRRYQRWRAKRGPVLRKHYVGGEVLFVDFSGKRPNIVDRLTGQAHEVELFVAVMGASNFTYVEAVATQRVEDWIGAHVRALSYLGGVPRTVVPDQLRSAVSEPDRYEPKVQRTYEDLGRHYGMAVIPARPRKPRDKAKVEAGVLVAQRWILARLRDETFFSIEALNARVRELLEDLNGRPMKSLGGVSRRELFERVDRPALMQLSTDRFEPAEWSKARVHEDYHVDVRRHWYSAPFELIGQEVEVRLTATMVELYRHGRRVAAHPRDEAPYRSSTDPRHRPPNHQAIFDGTRDQLMQWARDIGESTSELMQRLLDPEHNFSGSVRRRSGYGVRSLGAKYEGARIEEACRRVLALERASYKSVERILRLGLDQAPTPEAPPPSAPAIDHDQVRGADYFADDEDTEEEDQDAA
ncbi:MAG: IS21 family transposase [Sandaracinaceae bacterium]|nr:MAG: IS21 family transposase [Sandaracinaceae bacterium]